MYQKFSATYNSERRENLISDIHQEKQLIVQKTFRKKKYFENIDG